MYEKNLIQKNSSPRYKFFLHVGLFYICKKIIIILISFVS